MITAPHPALAGLRVLALVAVLATTATAQVVIFGNLAARTNDSGSSSSILGNGGQGKAMGFTMGVDSYTVTDVSLRLNELGGAGNKVPRVSIWTNDGTNKPGAEVGVFTNPEDFFSTPTTYVFTPASSLTLDANSSYFMVVQNVGTSSSENFYWQNNSPTNTPTGVASNSLVRFGNGSPTTWTGSSPNYNHFEMRGTAIPEPSAFAVLAGLGVLGLAASRRRARHL